MKNKTIKMKFPDLFINDEPIAGLEVSDNFLRLALLKFNKKKFSYEVAVLVEEPLPSNVVLDGCINNEKGFVAGLKSLLKKAGSKIRYVILSLPPGGIYTKVFSFPNTVDPEKLETSMRLAVDFQLPQAPDRIYAGWQVYLQQDKKEAFLAAIQRKKVDDYIKCLLAAKLNTVAVEFHPLSFARVLKTPGQGSFLIANQDDNYLCIIKDGQLRFCRTFPAVKQIDLKKEIKNVTNYYEFGQGPIKEVIDFRSALIKEEYAGHPLIKAESAKWLPSLGAALRGTMPRAKDNLLSLMQVGMETAYRYQKALNFSRFLFLASATVGIFFAAVFLGAFLLVLSLQQRAANQANLLRTMTAPANSSEIEAQAADLNNLTATVSGITKVSPNFSIVLDELQKNNLTGIYINQVNVSSAEMPITLAGVAKSRSILNQYKKTLEGSSVFSEVSIPLSNLEIKENIPFNLTFRMKDPNILYLQYQASKD